MPAALRNRPELEPYQDVLLSAFMLLVPDRPIGMGFVGGIPTVAIFAMADEIGEDRRIFLALCRALDAVYLERTRKK